MSTMAYEFEHSDGTKLGTVYSLEGNGPHAGAVPLQVREIDFSVTPVELVVAGNIVSRFPAAALNQVEVTSANLGARSITVLGEFSNNSQCSPGRPITLINTDDNSHYSGYIISAETSIAGTTTISVDFTLPSNLASWINSAAVSTVRGIELIGGAYEGVYLAHEQGAYVDADGNTRVRINNYTPLVMPHYQVVAAIAGPAGAFVIEDSANGSAQFRVGSTFNLAGNSFSGADGNYGVQAVKTSGTYTIIDVDATAGTITIAGDNDEMFINNKKISVSGGQAHNVILTIASASAVGSTTIITVVESIPSTVVASNYVVCTPPTTHIQVTSNVPAGVGSDGTLTPQQPDVFSFSAPPAITPTTPNNFLITWRIAGSLASHFTPGNPVLIKNNEYFKYDELPIQSVSESAGMTHIVTSYWASGSATPTPGAGGTLVYPAPAADSGYFTYGVDSPLSPLKLVGKGSPLFNKTATWGQAMQDNMINLTENFRSGLHEVPDVMVAGARKFMLKPEMRFNKSIEVGKTIFYSNDSFDPTSETTFTIQDAQIEGDYFTLTVAETIDSNYVGNGVLRIQDEYPTAALTGQLWYDQGRPQLMQLTNTEGWAGVVVQRVPAADYVDMGGNQIRNMDDPSAPSHAVNLATADRLYIAKTGGYSNNANDRSGSMTGSLNFGTRPVGELWNNVGINMAGSNMTMFTNADINFHSSSTGGINVLGLGDIVVEQGRIRVGDGVDNYVTIANHTGASPVITFVTNTTDNSSIDMGMNKIANVSTPTLGGDAANKAYVDSLSNGIVWLQPVVDSNLFHDGLSDPPFITAAVVGVTTGVGNTWTISGDWVYSIEAGQILTITGNDAPEANDSYLVVSASLVSGDTEIVVADNTIPGSATATGIATDTSIPAHKTYIVGPSATGDWAGLEGHAVIYTVTNIDSLTQAQTWGWLDVLGRAVQVGDRFGIFIEPAAEDPLNILPGGGLTGHAGKIATVAGIAPLSYTMYTPTEPYAFSVTGVSPTLNTNAGSTKSPHFGHSYTFRGMFGVGSYGSNYKWIEFAGPSMFAAGGGLKYSGNVLNVGAGAGINVHADTVQLDNNYASGIYVRRDGAYAMTGNLNLGNHQIKGVTTPTAGSDAANKSYTDSQDAQRVSKLGDTIAGSLVFTAGTVTGIAYPTSNQDAANKVYVDNQTSQRVAKIGDTMSGSLIMSGAGVGITLPNAPTVGTDAVNKDYADTKLSLNGGTMTGALQLAGAPVAPLDAAPKSYVDDNFVSTVVDSTMDAGVNVTFNGGEVLGLPATPTAANSATSKAYVDAQLTLKGDDNLVVHLAGTETITGEKTFVGVTRVENQLLVATNGVNNNLSITSTGISMTGTPVSSGGASDIIVTGGVNFGGIGGAMTLTGGNGSTNGGNVVITGGQGSTGVGGDVTISTGTGATNPGQLTLTAGSASLQLQTTGVWRVGGLAPTARSQALCANNTNPTTGSPTWQLVGTRVAAAPANSSAPGVIGNWFADDSFFYVYGATGWRRVATTTF